MHQAVNENKAIVGCTLLTSPNMASAGFTARRIRLAAMRDPFYFEISGQTTAVVGYRGRRN